MENRTPPGAEEQRNAAWAAWSDLCDLARTMPDWSGQTPAQVAEKVRRRAGSTVTDEEAETIYRAYRDAPHVCAVSTWHVFDKPCREGRSHPGCCPGRCPYEPKRKPRRPA
jgi:hypothetical protein